MQFVIVHGSFGNPEANWSPWLETQLKKLSQDVLAPAFPVDTWDRITELGESHLSEIQNLTNWTKTFEEKVLPWIKPHEPLCFIGHSLAPVFILHMVEKHNLQLDSAIFAAPFLQHLGRHWQIDTVNHSFYKTDFDFEKLKQLIPVSYALFSEDDPYVPKEKFYEFVEKLESEVVLVESGGHLNSDAGFTTFPKLFELCQKRISANS